VAAAATGRSVARKSTKKPLSKEDAQKVVLEAIATGVSREAACTAAGRTLNAYLDWMKKDPEFRAEIDRLRSARADSTVDGPQPVPDFPEFCEILGQPLHIHQLRMWDALEGREPRELLPAFRFDRGTEWPEASEQHSAGRVIVNLPPGHGKTTTFSASTTARG
jgi:hypothetical protein